jgi:hydroxymethylbilane synthase
MTAHAATIEMFTSPTIRIATRASRLALWQAEHVAAVLQKVHPGAVVNLVPLSTLGDRDVREPLSQLGSLGVFTREVQLAVLENRADVAVHSLKDLPTDETPGLRLVAVPERGPTSDALVFPQSQPGPKSLGDLPPGARIGTGSLRRRAQLLHHRPDWDFADVRGNVETRLRKLDAGDYDALVLAVAGLTRLGLAARISCELAPPLMHFAVGQGALGIECRVDDAITRAALSKIDHEPTHRATRAERALLAELRAGCHAPVGVWTETTGGNLRLEAVVLSRDGRTRLIADATGSAADPEQLGRHVAEQLRSQGADELIQSNS